MKSNPKMINKLKKYYTHAIRTSLLAQDRITNNWYHLFSVIELQPEEAYPYNITNDEWINNCIRSGKSKLENYTFYLNIDEIKSVDEAISIFSNPLNSFVIDGQKINFFNSSFIKEPSGNYPLVFASNTHKEEGLSSVLPNQKSGILVWCQIDSERKVEKEFIMSSTSREMQAIQKLTLDWLGFDLIQKKEHIGNIYLSAPNPYFREIDISLSTNPTGVFYKILRRKNVSEPLIFRIIDKHGDAIALDKTFEITNSIGLIELPHEPHLFELKIYNNDNYLIAVHEPATFLKSIQIGISMKQADVHITAQTEKGDKDFVVEKFSKEKPSIIGKPSNFNAEYYFKNAENQRKYHEYKKSKEFIFFAGTKIELEKSQLKDKAKTIIREILNQSNDSCYICDPYFNSNDIIEFAFHIKNSGVKIRILNSKQFITKEEASKITTILEKYNELPFSNIEVRTLRGDSILHDRFIVSDKNVWFVGSSFNEFGNRASCIAKVPESSNIQIIKEVEKWFLDNEYSENINDYSKESSDE